MYKCKLYFSCRRKKKWTTALSCCWGLLFQENKLFPVSRAWPINRDIDPTGSLSWERIWFPLHFCGTECVPSPVNTTCFSQTRIPFLTSHFMPHHSNAQIRASLWYQCCHLEPLLPNAPPPPPRWTRAPRLVFMLCCCCLEILNNFTFELGFCKWNRVEQWSMHIGRRDA